MSVVYPRLRGAVVKLRLVGILGLIGCRLRIAPTATEVRAVEALTELVCPDCAAPWECMSATMCTGRNVRWTCAHELEQALSVPAESAGHTDGDEGKSV